MDQQDSLAANGVASNESLRGRAASANHKAPRAALGIAGTLLLGLTIFRVVESWSNDSHLEHVAGVWVAEALDLSKGLFYRAPYGPYGYGGTRYFPLFFSLHALAIKISGSWRWTGYSLSALAVVLLLAAVYFFARRLGAGRWLAAAACFTLLAGTSVQDSLLTIREDAMAAMLNVWGLALCVDENASVRRLACAAAFFTLAFATKETTVFGAAAVFVYLLLNGRCRNALRFLALTAAGYALVLLIVFAGSGGRAAEVFRLVVAPGVSLHSIVTSPLNMVDEMGGYPGEMILLAMGAAALLAGGARAMKRLPALFFACALVVTLALFSSDGIAGNHLLDLYAASVIVVIDWAIGSIGSIGAAVQDFAVGAAAAVCMVVWLSLMLTHTANDEVPVRAQMQEVVKAIGPTNGTILAENPLIPIIAGQRPYILDPFSFRVMLEEEPSLGEPMWRMLREQRFAAVVFLHDPDSDEGRDFYAGTHFGEDFMDDLQADYRFAKTAGGEYIYLPRGAARK
jgi:Dolichyl-phosphate-mannose-protein mannosyltransferase